MTRSIPMEIPEEIAERVRAMVEQALVRRAGRRAYTRPEKYPGRRQAIVDAYRAGFTCRQIALQMERRFGGVCGHGYVINTLEEMGVDRRARGPKARADHTAIASLQRDEGASKGRGG